MGKLVKQKYTTADGEKKTYAYLVAIPKAVVNASEIDEDDELVAYEEYGTIVINKKYHCVCNECFYEWESGKSYDITTNCPRCHMAKISYTINGE